MIQVDLAPFSGPMDLLLALLRQAKIDIYDIEISQITEQFLAVMQQNSIPPDDLSDFIRMASILVQMKVRMLLKDQDDEDDGMTREEMIARLLEYRTYKELAARLQILEEEGALYYVKMGEDPDRFRAKPKEILEGTPQDLLRALREWQERRDVTRPQFSPKSVMVREEYGEDVVARRIRRKLAKGEHFTFLDLFDPRDYKKSNVIVTFLLMLELTRRHALELQQDPESQHISIKMRNRKAFENVLEWIDPQETENEHAE